MAIYTLPIGVNRINLSRGGSTFTKNSSGFIIRGKKAGLTNRSHYPTVRRTHFLYLIRQWALIPQIYKNSWISRASEFPFFNSLGDIYFLSGYQLFIKRNLVRLNQNYAIDLLASYPTSFANHLMTAIFINLNPTRITVYTNISPVPGYYEYRFSSTTFSADSLTNKHPDRYRILKTFKSGSVSPFALGPSYIERFGSGPEPAFLNSQIWSALINFEVYAVGSNQLSQRNTLKASVLPT